MMGKYILKDKKPIRVDDVHLWGAWFEKNAMKRIVAKTSTVTSSVSTVFLGLDHRFSEMGDPLVFETMVFGGPLDMCMERYSTWEDAVKGHEDIVDKVLVEEEQL